MRFVFISASALTRITTELMLEAGHEVVIIEKDEQVIEELDEIFDCSFMLGDGTRPHVLQEVDPGNTDCLFCVSTNDTANILAAAVARTMDFKQVVVRIDDSDLLPVCRQLALENIILPDQRVAREILAFVSGESDALDTEQEDEG